MLSKKGLLEAVDKFINAGQKEHTYGAIDIGSSRIKFLELDLSGEKPKVLKAAVKKGPKGAINNSGVSSPDKLGQVISMMAADIGFSPDRVAFAIPSPCVFTKRVTMPLTDLKTLSQNMAFEASNHIPFDLEAVKFDYQVVAADVEKSKMEVVFVAVRNEIVQTFIECLQHAGLNPAIADIDAFAIENALELCVPNMQDQSCAVVDIGSRFSTVSILKKGLTVYSGDVSVGGRTYDEAISDGLNVEQQDAEDVKLGKKNDGYDASALPPIIDSSTEKVVSELGRQLNFFWNAVDSENKLQKVYLTGGCALVPGLREELAKLLEAEVEFLDALSAVEVEPGLETESLKGYMTVALGLARRRYFDKAHAIS